MGAMGALSRVRPEAIGADGARQEHDDHGEGTSSKAQAPVSGMFGQFGSSNANVTWTVR